MKTTAIPETTLPEAEIVDFLRQSLPDGHAIAFNCSTLLPEFERTATLERHGVLYAALRRARDLCEGKLQSEVSWDSRVRQGGAYAPHVSVSYASTTVFVASSPPGTRIGIDVEPIFGPAIDAEAVSPEDPTLVGDMAVMALAAKEAAYKALAGVRGHPIEWRDLLLRWDRDGETWQAVSDEWPCLSVIAANVCGVVVAAAWMEALDAA